MVLFVVAFSVTSSLLSIGRVTWAAAVAECISVPLCHTVAGPDVAGYEVAAFVVCQSIDPGMVGHVVACSCRSRPRNVHDRRARAARHRMIVLRRRGGRDRHARANAGCP